MDEQNQLPIPPSQQPNTNSLPLGSPPQQPQVTPAQFSSAPTQMQEPAQPQPQFSALNTFQSTQAPTSQPQPATQPFVAQSMSQMQQSSKSGRKGKVKFVLAALAGLLLIGGGSAAAYFGVVVPNKPENVLRAAVQNTLKQQYATTTAEIEGKDGDSPAIKMAMTVKSDSAAKAMAAGMKFTMAGVTVPMEARLVDRSMFIKFGDLSNVGSLLSTAAPEYKPVVDTLGKSLSNQWVEIDSTLIAESGANCALDTELRLTDQDFAVIDEAYAKNSFAAITSTAEETVNGKPATKFVLNLDKTKGDEFAKGLKEMPLLKKIESCAGNTKSSAIDQEKVPEQGKLVSESGITTLNLWVDKGSKLITQVQTDLADPARKATGKAKLSMDYAKVSIEKPQGSKPITNYLLELGAALEGGPVLGAKIEQYIPGISEDL